MAPVYAPGDGIVTFAGVLPSTWGNVVIIKHATDPIIYSRSAHLDSFNVQKGQQVSKNQKIGNIGNAFNQLPYHLHYDLSLTNILELLPQHWPGGNLDLIKQHYIEPRALTLISQSGITSKQMFVNSPVNLRSGPSISFRVYEVLSTNTLVTVMGLVDDYNLVKVNNYYGFVHSSFLQENIPAPTGIDLRRFMIADKTAFRVVRMDNGQGEDIQDMDLGNNIFVRRKNDLGEWWRFDNNFFYLIHDTSPDVDSQGNARIYTLTKNGTPGAPKNPIIMNVGQSWQEVGTHHVQFRGKNNNCQPLSENSGNATNTTVLVDYKTNYTFNTYGQNLTLDEVVWIKTGVEEQIYARHNNKVVGWVGWRSPWGSSEIVELYWNRPPMTQEPNRYCGW